LDPDVLVLNGSWGDRLSDAENIKRTGKDQVKVVRTSDHRSHYVIGAIPQWTEDDLRLHMYNEIIEGVGGPYYVATTQIILPRSAVQRIMEELKKAVSSDRKGKQAEVTSMPLDVAVSVDHEIFEKEKRPSKKKVQKIRRK
jgi:hypothetical protein